MQWMLITLAYAVTSETVPRDIQFYELAFPTQDLCIAARDSMQADLRTRAVEVKATCVRVAE